MPIRALIASVIGLLAGATRAFPQDSIKIGLVLPSSGQCADAATQLGRRIGILRRDTGGVAPDVATRLGASIP